MIQTGLADYLLDTVRMGASDLHVTAGLPPMVRVTGSVQPLDYEPLTPNATRELVYDILSNDQRQRLENEWELDFSYSLPRTARFRVNVYFQRGAIGAAFRTIPSEIKSIKKLGLPEAVEDLTEKPRGLVLVTGPTGSGKSTTLAAMIDKINRTRHEHIMSVEDPIEFLLVGERRNLEPIARGGAPAETGPPVFGTFPTRAPPQPADGVIALSPPH